MIVIGERINSTRAHIQEALKARNAEFLLKEAKRQVEAGANYLDINCAMSLGDEVQDIDWAISVIQSELPDIGICIDSPNYLAIARALDTCKNKSEIFINSITGEQSRIDNIVPLAVKYDTKLIALTMGAEGMPNTAEDRHGMATEILVKVRDKGFNPANLYFDPLIRPISTEPDQAKEFLRSIPMIKALGVKTACGLSNVSFGLPDRKAINSAFLAMAIHAGLDAAIVDPTEKQIASTIAASRALLGDDEYCANYIRSFREGKLV